MQCRGVHRELRERKEGLHVRGILPLVLWLQAHHIQGVNAVEDHHAQVAPVVGAIQRQGAQLVVAKGVLLVHRPGFLRLGFRVYKV